ncbi:unnamed protein product [Clonostachys rhizophaga]|uniref:FAD dependent oxidoreductase domain-containing protein n=1 Tax=Clonostachys rhizophaga TaxID=160324 RepID=A0A9N9YHU2_9HYPO|nr:unnamed protein product [Clonostachys rhizophaga]
MTGIKLQDGQSGLPSPQSTSSFWHSEPSSKLLGHRTTPQLPAEADVVVVGSGITGTFAARELVSQGRGVVLLEAREACWGATGRNGGHCQPMVYLSKPEVARFELDTYHFLRNMVEYNKIPCSWATVGGVHGVTSRAAWDLVLQRVAFLQAWHPDLATVVRLVTDPDELRALRVAEGAVGAVVQACAAKCWPYKLVAWVLEGLLASPLFNLQTTTSVLHLQRLETKWMVHTDRGSVTASHVVLATNAYTSRLLPALTGIIRPVRGQVCALKPVEGAPLLEHSYVWTTQQEGDAGQSDDYLIQRDSGELILGGERMAARDTGDGIWRDDEVDPVVGRRLREALNLSLIEFPPKLEAGYEWTGIMGYSADTQPWIGKVPESLGGGDGLWISAGYTGHGMPVAARGGIVVAEGILGRKGIEIPQQWEPSLDRLEKARLFKMPETLEEELSELVKTQVQ